MDDTPRYSTLHDRLRMLRRYRVLIALITLVAAGLSLALSLRQDEKYQATAQLQFHDVNQDLGLVGSVVQAADAPAQLAAASASTLTRQDVMEKVKQQLRTKKTINQLRDSISATTDPTSNLVLVQADGGTAKFAAALANAAAYAARDAANIQSRNRFKIAARSLQAKLDGLSDDERLTAGPSIIKDLTNNRALARFAAPAQVAVNARVPDSPVSPKPIRNTILAIVVGLLLGTALAFLLNSLDRRLRNSHEIQGELGLPLLGHVREDMMGKAAHPGANDKRVNLRDFEAFRILRMNLDFLDIDSPLRTVAVTSALPEEGKSTVAASLALSAASMGTRTLLVECDLRRPALAKRLGLKDAPGLTDFLIGHADPQEILQTISVPGVTDLSSNGNGNGSAPAEPGGSLVCITAGMQNPRAGELLSSERFHAFLKQVAEAYELVVIDTTPLLPVADTLGLLPHVDRVLLCVRAAKTTRDQAMAGKAVLERFPTPAVGLVVTGERPREESQYGQYQPYAYEYTNA